MTKKQWDKLTYSQILENGSGYWHWGFFWIMENRFRIQSVTRLEKSDVVKFSSANCSYPDYRISINKKKAKEYFNE